MNPFSRGNIARGENFYDREKETQRIVETLRGGNNIVLFAPRRYGKTSLVFKVMDELEASDVLCVYVDLMAIYSVEHFAETYMKCIMRMKSPFERLMAGAGAALRSIRPTLTLGNDGTPEIGVNFIEENLSGNTIGELLDLPEQIARENGRRVVVVFDEFQEIVKFEKIGLESIMRSKIQHHQNVNYLFLGSKTHLLANMFQNKNRPFYGTASVVQISSLPRQDTIEYITRRFANTNISIPKECCELIIDEVADIPYYIQLLAAEVWQYVVNTSEKIDNKTIDICAKSVVDLKRDYYHELFDRHSATQKKLMTALATSGENIFSTEYARRFRFGATSSIQKAAAALMDEGVIDKMDNKYFVSDPFFRRYLKDI